MTVNWKLLEDQNYLVNEECFTGRVAVGDTLETSNAVYSIQAINEDGIVVKELKVNV